MNGGPPKNPPQYHLGGSMALFRCSSYCKHAPPTVNAAPPTVNATPSTVNMAPYTVNLAPPTVNAAPPTVNAAPPTVYAAPPIINWAPPTVNVAPPTVNWAPPPPPSYNLSTYIRENVILREGKGGLLSKCKFFLPL